MFEQESSWSLGTAALRGAARWSEVFLPEELWALYADAAAGASTPSEIYIALAIAAGVDHASDAFEADYFVVVDRVLRQAGADADELADVKAELRERLFATHDGLQLLRHYAAHGRLAELLREVALQAVDEVRASAPALLATAA